MLSRRECAISREERMAGKFVLTKGKSGQFNFSLKA